MSQKPLSDPQLSDLCHGFSQMLHAGIPLADSAFLLTEGSTCRQVTEALGNHLDQGLLLSEAMDRCGGFPDYFTGMIRVGEKTGHLQEALASLEAFLEERQRVARQIRNAVCYPCMILLLLLLVMGVMLIQVLPVFDRVYASLGSGLTGIAAGLLELGQTLQNLLPALLILLILGILSVAVLALCPGLRARCAGAFRRRFGDRGISRKYNNARFARAVAMGLAGGMTLEETLNLAGLMLAGIPGAARRCGLCADALARGATLAEAMGEASLLDKAACRLLSLGFRGGKADCVMQKIADELAEEADLSLERSISRIEPAMVLAASLLVGAVLLTVMLPLMNILSGLG